MTDEQVSLANAMVEYWTRFAHTGDPNSDSGTGTFWPRYVSGADATFMSLVPPGSEPLPSADFAADHKCQFWATQG